MTEKLTSNLLLVDVPWENADLYYLAPFSASDPVLFLKRGTQKYLMVNNMEAARAKRLFPKLHVLTPLDLTEQNARPLSLGECCVSLLRHLQVQNIVVPSNFPAGVYQHLREAEIKVEISEKPVCPEREIKTEEEITNLRQSQTVAVKAMQAAISMIQRAEIDERGTLCDSRGILTSERVKQTVHEIMLRHNCLGWSTIIACGKDAADPHETGHGPLYAHQSIVLDFFPRHQEHGYWGDLTRTVVKGTPPLALRSMYQAVKEAQTLALANIRDGVSARYIYDLVLNYFTKTGFQTVMTAETMEGFIHSVGHGLGLEIHEPPGIGLKPNKLRKGQVVTVEPGLYYRVIGGVRIEDVVVVTDTGCRILVDCPHVFQV